MRLFNKIDSFGRIYDIDIRYLKDHNIHAVIADADNTLLPWHGDDFDEKTLGWLSKLSENNIFFCILSNGKRPRITTLAGKINAKFIASGLKPLPFGYIKACKLMGISKNNCLFIGDQMFTDILGARLAGIRAALVDPVSKHEFYWTKFMRNIEKIAGRKFKW